jgi:apolipoprotein N-acyltransferase
VKTLTAWDGTLTMLAMSKQAEANLPSSRHSWRWRSLMGLASVAMLSLSYAPVKQFYFAWVALVPFLLVIARARSKKEAFFWSWGTGILFFSVNMWWIGYVTVIGAIALMFYMGLWFGLAGVVIRGAGLLGKGSAKPQAVVLIPAIWVAAEWTWGNLFTGLPWLYLGHTQTPILAMCQIADLTSVYGVSFWVMMVNACVTLFILRPKGEWRRLAVPGVAVVLVLAAVLGYGLFRMGQRSTYPGPLVVVVQPNIPQDNSGAKGETDEERLAFHVKTTVEAIGQLQAKGETADLVAWSETMMPPLNEAYRRDRHDFIRKDDRRNVGELLDAIYEQISNLARSGHTNLLVGAESMLPDRPVKGKDVWDRRNSAYLFDRSGRESTLRYDKMHLVPFGEFIPFRESFPPLYKFFNWFNPYGDADYTVQAGTELTVFPIEPGGYRFVSAICFEDVDSRLMARNFAGPNGTKRADFIVNLTNDGWFATPQMQQHLQLSVFRCIENRVPTARSVNTGVSGFIDSVGRTHDLIPVHTTGARASRLELDHRVAPYTHVGDVFAGVCLVVAGGTILLGVWKGMKNRRLSRR